MPRKRSTAINEITWVVVTIGKHIVAQESLICAYKNIGIEEPTQRGVIVTGLEVVEPELTNVVVAARLFSGHLGQRFCGYPRINFLTLIIRKIATICNIEYEISSARTP